MRKKKVDLIRLQDDNDDDKISREDEDKKLKNYSITHTASTGRRQ